MTILDHIAATHNRFRPSTPTDLFALCLAYRLGDAEGAAHYASMALTAGQDSLLAAYARAKRGTTKGETIARRFHKEIRPSATLSIEPAAKILSLQVQRRTIAAAVFVGTHLDFTDSLELSSILGKAEASTIGFLNWLNQKFECGSAVLENPPSSEGRRAALDLYTRNHLRVQGVSIWDVPKPEVAQRFGFPPPLSLLELRQIICSIWPILNPDKTAILDAAALGLYVQTERLFIFDT